MADAGGALLCRGCLEITKRREYFTRHVTVSLLIFVAFLWCGGTSRRTRNKSVRRPLRSASFALPPWIWVRTSSDNSPGPVEDASRSYPCALAPWLNAEHTRYTGNTGPPVSRRTRGPFAVDLNPPRLHKDGDSWFTAMFRAWRYPLLPNLAADRVPIDTYTVKVYVMYGGTEYDMASYYAATQGRWPWCS